ncbi:BON domain-containing protein [Thioalkalivibrio sp. XN279]|uniref:BON domain-containing protein n=1 Tax=Thioalkalivibrio sp. XN279 TaxID=2714953 RepID=UPI001409F079|nr:BON domain-containing protein [Thioalkalivibrio sp. XN279]NHA14763.1 BON domain-containing protein [Thioalkalivibrio sp. XN279]
MNYEFADRNRILRTACLVTLLAAPLAACSDRPDTPEGAQPDVQQMVRDKEAERRPGSEQPEVTANDVDYDDEYGKPRESWTGGTTAGDGEIEGSAENDARAERMLREELAGRDGFRAIEIDVQDGIAHLRGEVESIVEYREAETLAMAMEDVVEVRNDLEIAARSD